MPPGSAPAPWSAPHGRLLRARYGGVADVVLAVTRSCGRDSIPGAESVIGPLINTVPLRVRIDEGWSVRELLTAVNEGIRRIREHQRTPMGSALAWAGLARGHHAGGQPARVRPAPAADGLSGGDAAPCSVRMDRLPSYPLMLCAYDEPQLHLSFIWDRCCFADGSAGADAGPTRATLIELAGDLWKPLADLDLGRAPSATCWPGGTVPAWTYPAGATIPALFAAQVAQGSGRDRGGLRHRTQ